MTSRWRSESVRGDQKSVDGGLGEGEEGGGEE